MRLVLVAVAVAACASPQPSPPNPTAPATADGRAQIATATRAWLAGDLDAAIAELTRAGADPVARALLARVELIAGRANDAKVAATQALAGRAAGAAIVGDVSRSEDIVVSPDGAYIATVQHPKPQSVTVWSVLDGRDVFTVAAERVAFVERGREMLAVTLGREDWADRSRQAALEVRSAATGVVRWRRSPADAIDLAVDRRGSIWLLTKEHIEQLDVATGESKRAVPKTEYVVLDVSADGSTALCSQIIIDLATGKRVGNLAFKHWEVKDEAISPDGQMIAVGYEAAVELYARDGTLRTRFGAPANRVAFLDDGTLIATDGRRVTRWDANGTSRAALDLPAEFTKAVDAYSPASIERTPVGAGGHAVLRRGGELVVVRLADTRAITIAALGGATRADLLAWSADGAQLAIGNGRNNVAVWTTRGATDVPNPDRLQSLQFDAAGKVLVNAWPPATPTATIQISDRRIFVRADAKSALRFVDAPELVVAADAAGKLLVAAGASGTLYLWDAVTAEGLGQIESPLPVSAIAVRGDGRLVAVGRWRGGVEMWDVASRTLAFTVATWTGGWVVATPSGRVDGQDRAVLATSTGLTVPGVGLPHETGLAAAVLAHPPPAIAIARTPAPTVPAHACLPASDTRFQVMYTDLDGDALTYCLREGVKEDPYCFRTDLATRKVAPVEAPVEVLADREVHEHRGDGGGDPDDRRDGKYSMVDDGVQVCDAAGCRMLPVKLGEADQHRTLLAAMSTDAKLVVVGSVENDFVEVFDVATVKRLARFRVRYGRKGAGADRELAFFAHDILAISKPCAGPCAEATLYTPAGRFLGPFPIEASVPEVTHFHDDLYVVADELSNVAIQNTATGAILFRTGGNAEFAVTPERVVIAHGDPRPDVLVVDRRGKLAARIAGPPRCKP